MSSRKDLALGIFIVVAGVVILLGKLGVFGFGQNVMAARPAAAGYFLHILFLVAGLLPPF